MKKEKSKTAKNIWRALSLATIAAVLCVGSFFAGCLVKDRGGGSLFVSDGNVPATDNGGMMITMPETVAEEGVSISEKKLTRAEFALYSISPLAETASVLTATITPEGTDDKWVDWTIDWVNPASEWASGKNVTEHMKITPTAPGSLEATAECLKEFAEEIEIKVVPRANKNLSAICTVGYRQKLLGVEMSLSHMTMGVPDPYEYTTDPTGGDKTFEMPPLEGSNNGFVYQGYYITASDAYTIPLNRIHVITTMALSESFYEALRARELKSILISGRAQSYDTSDFVRSVTGRSWFTMDDPAVKNHCDFIGLMCDGISVDNDRGGKKFDAETFYKFLLAAKATEGYHFSIHVTATGYWYTYDEHMTLVANTKGTFSSESLTIYPADIGVSNGRIEF